MSSSKDRYHRLKSEGLCVNCGLRSPIRNTVHCDFCMEPKRLYQRKMHESRKFEARARQKELKERALEAYGGPQCQCCGESYLAFLTIDHQNGDGARHRRQIGHHNLYTWLKSNQYPQDLGLRVLCLNCNYARRFGRHCPHTDEEDLEYDCSVGLLQHVS